ncbi:MAG: Gfo/Idh/MocA family oxidoreductase [Pirellulales bacterium]|nr:Gfo/Idh/MocA family oxidoreductase [Pirellulales bacterium]
MHSNRMERRRFLALGSAAFALPTLIPRGVLAKGDRPGANDRVIVGVVSAGHRARLLMEQLPPSAQQVALADCNLPQALEYRKKRGTKWDIYGSHHPLIARRDIDAVIIAGQEYQRVLPCIHAVQAGKDVYAEKPLCLYIEEGRVLVRAVRKHKRVFQVGSQQRSMAMNRVACEFVKNGGLGKLKYVSVMNYTGVGPTPPVDSYKATPIPSGFNWDLHLNQSEWRPFGSGATIGRNYVGGQMTNWGAHGVDQVQWALGKDNTLPVEFEPVTPGVDGKVNARYADGSLVKFEIPKGKGPMGGAIFIGEKGKLEINRNKFMSNPIDIRNQLLKQVNETDEEAKWSDKIALWQARWHMQNWLDCIKTRERPVADVEIGHRSIAFCHLANITRWMGRKLKFDPETERFVDDDEANAWNDRPRRKGYELPEVS